MPDRRATRATTAIELITEYPDEITGGSSFRLGQECQFQMTVAGAEIFAAMTDKAPVAV